MKRVRVEGNVSRIFKSLSPAHCNQKRPICFEVERRPALVITVMSPSFGGPSAAPYPSIFSSSRRYVERSAPAVAA